MNKKEYLERLLTLCTKKQTDLFNRMYPDGVEKKKLDWATGQVERTLKGLNESAEELRTKTKEYNEDLEAKDKEVKANLFKVRDLESELAVLYRRFERMSEVPSNKENDRIQERLDLLDALEAGGVDNWEWYSESITQHRENQ